MRAHRIVLLIFFCRALFAQDFARSVVSISVTTQGFEYYSPWTRGNVEKKTLTGCVIGGQRILTLAQPLANHVLIEVSKRGSEQRYPAEVVLKDYNYGLALLTVKDNSFFADMEPVEFAPGGEPKGRALVVKWDQYGALKKYAAEAFKTAIGFYKSGGAVLIHHMTTGLDSGGNGEPVFIGRQLVGITSYFDSAQKTIKVHAVDSISRMLQDLDDGEYGGMPFFVVANAYLKSDENLRDYLGLGPEDTGILVNNVYPKTSGHDVLKKGDVILSMDGLKIDDSGFYDSDVYGKLNYYGIICLSHFVGDRLRMQIVRDKKKMDVSFDLLPITNECCLIPLLDYDTPPQYHVLGGLVFQELTEGYMTTWGSDWTKKGDKRILFLYDSLAFIPSPERRRLVILNRVLPASVNAGYHEKKNLVLLKVNGTPIRNLKHFKETVESTRDRFFKFDFQGGESIVLGREWVEQSNEAILKQYNITAQSWIER